MENTYDEILYTGHPFPQTHPNRLAVVGRIFGMQPAPVESCRLLELGCGDGGNLIPMAYTLPGSQFVGIDLGARGIAIGQERAQMIGLANLRLHHLDMMDESFDLGMFDYIIAHGVYAWVPSAVQTRMLEICRTRLNPHGIAYVSYSAYPGAYIKRMIAEMLRYHAGRFPDAKQQIQQARALLQFLSMTRPDPDVYAALLQREAESVMARHSHTVYHDELNPDNDPLYFREFAETAARHGLQYLGEADFFEMRDSFLEEPEAAATLRSLGRDQIDREQFMDFVKCRRFRQTLLCHGEVPLNRAVQSGLMRQFRTRLAGPGNPPQMPTTHPVAMEAVKVYKDVWPVWLEFEDLLARIREGAGRYEDDDALLADLLLALFACGMVQPYVHAPPFTRQPGERPRSSAVARMQLKVHTPAAENQFVTTLTHEVVQVEDSLGLLLLSLLDGSRDRPELMAEIQRTSPQATREDLDRGIDQLGLVALLEA